MNGVHMNWKNMHQQIIIILFLAIFVSIPLGLQAQDHPYFKIRVIDEQTGRGIPLVEIRTQSWIRYYTDSNGLVAFYEPGLMDQDLYLFIQSEGYDYPPDLLGNRGFVINAAKSDSLVVKMQRINIAERLYRITGAGIYHDSFLLGEAMPLKHPLLNGKVLGQDSNISTIFNDQIIWLWGDTFKPAYAWGNFSVSAATSQRPENGGLPPQVGVDLNYFVDSTGFSKSMIRLEGKGFVWFDWVMAIEDDNGEEQLIAKYARVRTDFTNHERGVAVFNEQTQMFEKYIQIDEWLSEYHSCHHHFFATVADQSYAFLTSEFRFSRVKPALDHLIDPAAYEAYSCLKEGSVYDAKHPALDRDASGQLIWSWKKQTEPVGLAQQKELLGNGFISTDEQWCYFQDMATGDPLDFRRGSIYWNDYRRRWILIIQRDVGEIWYAEADTPIGPWMYAQKVADHDQYFYNPVQHTFFDQEGGRIIYFEGTYTNMFNVNPVMKPRYEYNQIMYRLTLDDHRLFMPLPVYQVGSAQKTEYYGLSQSLTASAKNDPDLSVAFFAYAPARHPDNLVPVYQHMTANGPRLNTEEQGEVLFYALPADDLPYEQFLGAWRCHMTDGIFLNRDFGLDMTLSENNLVARINNAGYSVRELNSSGNRFDMTVHYVDKIYHFEGQIQSGKISGTWANDDSTSSGTWNGRINDHQWEIVHSPRLAPLYRYDSRETSHVIYAPENENLNQTMDRSEQAVCRVWASPSPDIPFDFGIVAESVK